MLTKHAECRTTATARIRTWTWHNGRVKATSCRQTCHQNAPEARYSLVEVNSLLDQYRRYLVVQTLPGGGQVILSRHRKRKPAAQALEHFARG